jgi:nucleoside-diphosphate-sugar epimerase
MPDLVLLTGVSGFLGGHVALALLRAGYRVRGSVRDLHKADKVTATLSRHGADVTQLEVVALDLLRDDGWAAAMAGVRYLQHTASPFVRQMPRDKDELIRPAVEGTERALETALAAGVERIVLTSSMAAIMYGHDPARVEAFTDADWTDLGGRPFNAYVESKTRAERRAWELVDAAGRHDCLAVINPAGILGPLLDDDPGTSAAMVSTLLTGGVPAAPRIAFNIVDVRHVADLHVAALARPEAGGHRFPAGLGPVSIIEVARMLAPAFTDRARRFPRFEMPDWLARLAAFAVPDLRDNLAELGVIKRIEVTAAEKLLGRALIPPSQAALATARTLIANGVVPPMAAEKRG